MKSKPMKERLAWAVVDRATGKIVLVKECHCDAVELCYDALERVQRVRIVKAREK